MQSDDHPKRDETTEADIAWTDFVNAALKYAPHLDQWDKFKFQTEYGTVYVTIGRHDPYPDSFEELQNAR